MPHTFAFCMRAKKAVHICIIISQVLMGLQSGVLLRCWHKKYQFDSERFSLSFYCDCSDDGFIWLCANQRGEYMEYKCICAIKCSINILLYPTAAS